MQMNWSRLVAKLLMVCCVWLRFAVLLYSLARVADFFILLFLCLLTWIAVLLRSTLFNREKSLNDWGRSVLLLFPFYFICFRFSLFFCCGYAYLFTDHLLFLFFYFLGVSFLTLFPHYVDIFLENSGEYDFCLRALYYTHCLQDGL